jgi:hypothetical protein
MTSKCAAMTRPPLRAAAVLALIVACTGWLDTHRVA